MPARHLEIFNNKEIIFLKIKLFTEIICWHFKALRTRRRRRRQQQRALGTNPTSFNWANRENMCE